MERTQVYLDQEQKEELQKVARNTGKTMAEIIREAVAQYITTSHEQTISKLTETSGLWKNRKDMGDSDKYVNNIRKNWNSHMEEQK